MDVDPHVIGTAQWKTVRIKRVTNKGHVQKMSPDGHPNSSTCGHLKLLHPERGLTMG